MATGHLVLLVIAAVLLAVRIGQALLRRGDGTDAPTYPEPTLALDVAHEAPHDVFGELESTLDADHAAEGRYLASKQEASEHLSEKVPVARKVAAASGMIVLLVALPYVHPSLGWFRLLSGPIEDEPAPTPIAAAQPLPEDVVGEWDVPEATYDQEGRARDLEGQTRETRGPIAQARDTMPAAVDEDKPPRSLEDPSGKALDAFFAKLVALERKDPGAKARVIYYGDSVIASDFITGKLRRMLQTRFGDGGHGYAIVANAWPGWFHYDVSRKASAEWKKSTCVGPYAEDGLYGLGCASFTTEKAGVWSEMGTNPIESYEWNQAVSRFEIEYLEQPGGGALDLYVDGEKRERLETDGEIGVAWHAIDVPDGPHTLKIETADDRPVRVFGIAMDRPAGGISLSALGVTGARARFLDKQDDAHWREVLAHTQADLVVLSFGGNEVQDGNKYPMEKYRETLEAVMVQVEKALPDASYMLVGPTDMASAKASQGHSLPMVYFIVEEQKKLAKERGWAFWDQFRAMGGGGTMWAWIKQGLGNPDMFHPTGEGGGLLGKWEYLALMEAFEKYKADRR